MKNETPNCLECNKPIAIGDGFSTNGFINRPMYSKTTERVIFGQPGDGTLKPPGVLLKEPVRNFHFACLKRLVRKFTKPSLWRRLVSRLKGKKS